jgi:signal peptidase I
VADDFGFSEPAVSDPYGLRPHDSIPPSEHVESRPRGRHRTKKQKSGVVSFLVELPILIVIALVVAVVIKTFLVQAFYIPSGSMIPTLQVDDRVMVNKLSYRFGEPDRGDVVVFDSPFAPSHDSESFIEGAFRTIKESLGIQTATIADDLIKRVMALPGETIEIRQNTVYVDGVPIDEPYLSPGVIMEDFGPQFVPDGTVFVMGDNRGSSQDSRKFGAIPIDSIVGRAFVIVWPFDRWGGL